MPNTHKSHKHGLHTMNADRPKSKMWKRRNKAKAKERKEVLLQALADASNPGKKTAKVTAPKETTKKEVKKAPAKTVKKIEEKPEATKAKKEMKAAPAPVAEQKTLL